MENSGLTYGMSVSDVIVTIGVIGGIMNERYSHDKNRLEWGRDTSTLPCDWGHELRPRNASCVYGIAC
jgi:hypothetical protein